MIWDRQVNDIHPLLLIKRDQIPTGIKQVFTRFSENHDQIHILFLIKGPEFVKAVERTERHGAAKNVSRKREREFSQHGLPSLSPKPRNPFFPAWKGGLKGSCCLPIPRVPDLSALDPLIRAVRSLIQIPDSCIRVMVNVFWFPVFIDRRSCYTGRTVALFVRGFPDAVAIQLKGNDHRSMDFYSNIHIIEMTETLDPFNGTQISV
jgi:hypothetical protein